MRPKNISLAPSVNFLTHLFVIAQKIPVKRISMTYALTCFIKRVTTHV
ncbi:hypothetical protein SAMN05216420_102144 [Nitrosospira sp. Nl5]|nr:hypothetical protein SAMN05216420_102144 [Nitrosospira sp. Nl5]